MRYGHLLIQKSHNLRQYLYYDSFDSDCHWKWGSKRLSEIFMLKDKLIKKLLDQFPGSVLVFVPDNPNYATCMETD